MITKRYLIFTLLSFTCFQLLAEQDKYTIYVSSISWHTGLVIPGEVLPDSIWREGHEYGEAEYLEIGWGDADFYPSEGFNLWYAFKAVFWPTRSVLHIKPIARNPENHYYNTNVVKIELNKEQMETLVQFLVRELNLDESGQIIPSTQGLYSDSHFYEGSSRYYFPNNSNVWVARAIRHAGFPLRPLWLQTTGMVLNKVEDFGTLVVEKD
ncbi:DUF2459 domain-containing protein [Litoribacter ruber]|uniref:DUF2459 domain-containing protein n=1 Tax=Litoribacter ruber TaxID=702568 RepID=A0AAP2CK67_9BACT|nr:MULTISPECIES: DUF2459 domain-containing protein [Litoribacter]MBS9525460.1 DUF2459 domain-containing protein [Litoribacter alkaliphilus]MBT0809705.1 DUF2459 domain-containing protein [Litoribacter ruber]